MNFSFDDWLYLIELLMPLAIAGAIAAYRYLLTRLPEARRGQMERIINTVVAGVEQYGVYKGYTPEQKKAYAMKAASYILHKAGLKVSDQMLDLLIEATVAALPPTHQVQSAS
jgi:hypothetical protein